MRREGLGGVFAQVMAGVVMAGLLAGSTTAQEVPFLAGPVTDLAEMLSDSDARGIEQQIRSFEAETGSQIAVLTIPSLEGYAIEDYSIKVAETWRLGREGIDDGVLLLIARDERRMRLEVGYGLEPALTDARARRILDHVITPRFRSGDFGGGVEDGVNAVMATIRGEVPAPVAGPGPPVSQPASEMVAVLAQLLFFLFLIYLMTRMRRRGRRAWSSRSGWDPHWSHRPHRTGPVVFIPPRVPDRPRSSGRRSGRGRGGFGGGGFSGGGGGFGGGGASGGW